MPCVPPNFALILGYIIPYSSSFWGLSGFLTKRIWKILVRQSFLISKKSCYNLYSLKLIFQKLVHFEGSKIKGSWSWAGVDKFWLVVVWGRKLVVPVRSLQKVIVEIPLLPILFEYNYWIVWKLYNLFSYVYMMRNGWVMMVWCWILLLLFVVMVFKVVKLRFKL